MHKYIQFGYESLFIQSWRVPDQMEVIPTTFSSIYLILQKDKKIGKCKKKLPSAEYNETDSIAKESKKASDKSCHPGEPVLPRLSKDQNENINTKRRKIEINNKQDPVSTMQKTGWTN